MPLAFFCTLFFRHRKKSVSAPWDGQSLSAPESARQAPPGAGDCACGRTGGFPLAPGPFGSPPETIERPIGLQALPSRRYRRVRPRQGELLTAKLSFIDASRGLSARPLHPFGESAYPQGGSMCLRAHQRAFLGEKQSARPALPYTPLVASLISRF